MTRSGRQRSNTGLSTRREASSSSLTATAETTSHRGSQAFQALDDVIGDIAKVDGPHVA